VGIGMEDFVTIDHGFMTGLGRRAGAHKRYNR
jgi:hypothetical protein